MAKSLKNNNSLEPEDAQKILRSVPYEKGFHFFSGVGQYTGETAINLSSFTQELKVMDIKSVRFHFGRCDYQKWIADTLGDVQLADRVNMIESNLPDEDLKKEVLKVLQTRVEELQTILREA